MEITVDMVEPIVNERMKDFSEDIRKKAVDFLVRMVGAYHPAGLQKPFDLITGGGYDITPLTQKILSTKNLMELKSSGFTYYQWLSGACPAKGHNRMDGKICSVNEGDSYYVRGPKKTLNRRERAKGMPKGSPADCNEFCNCCIVCFDPKLFW